MAAAASGFDPNMFTQMMSAGAMGGGVSSAVSRALGAGNLVRARQSALHATVIGGVVGVVYSILFLIFGPALYHLLGARDGVLQQAVSYGNVLFAGAVLVCLYNTLASVLRGGGKHGLAALVTGVVGATAGTTAGAVAGIVAGTVAGTEA